MGTSLSTSRRPEFLTVRQTAWLLAVPTSTVARLIRSGTVRSTWQRSRLVIRATDVTRLMGGAR